MDKNTPETLYDLLLAHNFNVSTMDSQGKSISNMEEATLFSFDVKANGNDVGPIVISLTSDEKFYMYHSNNVTTDMTSDEKLALTQLKKQLKTFAIRHLFQEFEVADFTKITANKDSEAEFTADMNEGYYGTRKTSYNPQGKAKIIIKHSKPIGEGDKRFRHISQVFIENAEGERFKLPFTKLPGARAMARHVTEGGNPYDDFGKHIIETVSNINTLGGFLRKSKTFMEDEHAAGLVETGRAHYQTMRKGLQQMSGKRGYHTYKESWTPAEAIVEQGIDEIKKVFTREQVITSIDEVAPMLARAKRIAEANKPLAEEEEFNEWADKMAEGTWAGPNDEQTIEDLEQWMADEQPVGIDGINATESLYSIIGDEGLFDELVSLADRDPEADARELVQGWLLQNMPEVASRLNLDDWQQDEHHQSDHEESWSEEGDVEESIDIETGKQCKAQCDKPKDPKRMKTFSEIVEEIENEEEENEDVLVKKDEKDVEDEDKDSLTEAGDEDCCDDEEDDEAKESDWKPARKGQTIKGKGKEGEKVNEESGSRVLGIADADELGSLLQRTNYLLRQ